MTKEYFLSKDNAWGSHRKLLWEALEATKTIKQPIVELGSGKTSTPYLRKYSEDEEIQFISFESDLNWAREMGTVHVNNWDAEKWWSYNFSVCLLDMAPGEYRKTALMKLVNTEIIVIHDSEPSGWNASDYKVRPLFKNFKYMIDDKPTEKGAPWTTAVSNTVDVSKWKI